MQIKDAMAAVLQVGVAAQRRERLGPDTLRADAHTDAAIALSAA